MPGRSSPEALNDLGSAPRGQGSASGGANSGAVGATAGAGVHAPAHRNQPRAKGSSSAGSGGGTTASLSTTSGWRPQRDGAGAASAGGLAFDEEEPEWMHENASVHFVLGAQSLERPPDEGLGAGAGAGAAEGFAATAAAAPPPTSAAGGDAGSTGSSRLPPGLRPQRIAPPPGLCAPHHFVPTSSAGAAPPTSSAADDAVRMDALAVHHATTSMPSFTSASASAAAPSPHSTPPLSASAGGSLPGLPLPQPSPPSDGPSVPGEGERRRARPLPAAPIANLITSSDATTGGGGGSGAVLDGQGQSSHPLSPHGRARAHLPEAQAGTWQPYRQHSLPGTPVDVPSPPHGSAELPFGHAPAVAMAAPPPGHAPAMAMAAPAAPQNASATGAASLAGALPRGSRAQDGSGVEAQPRARGHPLPHSSPSHHPASHPHPDFDRTGPKGAQDCGSEGSRASVPPRISARGDGLDAKPLSAPASPVGKPTSGVSRPGPSGAGGAAAPGHSGSRSSSGNGGGPCGSGGSGGWGQPATHAGAQAGGVSVRAMLNKSLRPGSLTSQHIHSRSAIQRRSSSKGDHAAALYATAAGGGGGGGAWTGAQAGGCAGPGGSAGHPPAPGPEACGLRTAPSSHTSSPHGSAYTSRRGSASLEADGSGLSGTELAAVTAAVEKAERRAREDASDSVSRVKGHWLGWVERLQSSVRAMELQLRAGGGDAGAWEAHIKDLRALVDQATVAASSEP